MLVLLSPTAVAVILINLPSAALLLTASIGLGHPIARLLLPRDAEPDWRWMAAAGMGLGTISLLMLTVGLLGIMSPRVLTVGAITFAMIGMASLRAERRRFSLPASSHDGTCRGARNAQTRHGAGPAGPNADAGQSSLTWLWLLAAPFAALALLVTTFPPGILWPAEGNGYDVLEYHLGAPRDWLDAGRILYLPHNIYSNFPMNVEMLYLWTLAVENGSVAAAIPAQLVNASLAALAVGAVWLAARQVTPGFGVFAAALAASCPFLCYLCGLAYVENGLIFFCATSLAAMLRAQRATQHNARWLAISGLFAGFACGCKYTGVPVVLTPLAIAAILSPVAGNSQCGSIAASLRSRLTRLGVFVVPAVLVLSPWLIRNTINTGNPVFPLAQSIMPTHENVWNADGAARWAEGHLPAPEHRSLGGRSTHLWNEIGVSPLFGALPILLVIAGVMIVARRENLALAPCWVMVGITLACWLGFTHLVDRFAVTLIVPISIIVAAVAARLMTKAALLAVPSLIVVVVIQAALMLRTCADGHVFELTEAGAPGSVHWFKRGEWPTYAHVPRVNDLTASGRRVLVVADARRFYLNHGADYCVVFNNYPFADAAGRMSADQLVAWLSKEGYSHVFVHWGEMRRLRNSRYGFWQSIDEALFTRMESAGLSRVEDFLIDPERGTGLYGTLYSLPSSSIERAR